MSITLQNILLLTTITFCVYIPLVPISVLYANVDPYHFLLQIMIKADFALFEIRGIYSFAQVLRAIVLFFNCYQVTRKTSLSVLTAFPYFDTLSRVTSTLKHYTESIFPQESMINTRLRILVLIRSVRQIQVIGRSSHYLNECCGAGSMAAICTLFNVTILIGYNKIVFSFYVYIVSANCLGYIVSYLTLLPVIKTFDNCCEINKGLLLNIISTKMNMYQKRFCKLKVRSLQPWSLSIGFGKFRFFYITNSTKVLFYNHILSNTINLLLSISLS